MKALFALGAFTLALTSVSAFSSELDPVSAAAPKAVLVRVDAQGHTQVFKADQVIPQNSSPAVVEGAIAATATPAHLIANVTKVQGDELDQDSSTPAWRWHGYGNYWCGAGSYFNYGYYNYGYSNYYSYNYAYAYPYYYNNYSWYWYW